MMCTSWQTLTPLKSPLCHAGMVSVYGRLYVVGGRTYSDNRFASMNDVLRYTPDDDTWHIFAKLRVARHDAACAAVGPS